MSDRGSYHPSKFGPAARYYGDLLRKAGQRIAALEKELAITDELLKARTEVIKLIPPCSLHGDECLPHAREWIERMKAVQQPPAQPDAEGRETTG